MKVRIPMCHRLFFKRISQNSEYIQTFAMIKEFFFILHVRNGLGNVILFFQF